MVFKSSNKKFICAVKVCREWRVYWPVLVLIGRCHAKKDGKGEYSINILHYIETLLKKPKALPNSYALKQAPDFFQSIFNQYFSTNPKEFLLLLKNFESFDELSKYGFKKDDIEEMITNDFGNCLSDIDTVSLNQLHLTSRLFGQEVVDE